MESNDPKPSLAELSETQRTEAMARFAVLRPHLEQEASLQRVAGDAGVPVRTARRWLARYRAAGLIGLARVARADVGKCKMPEEMVEPIKGLFLRKPRPSAAAIHRTQPGKPTTQSSVPATSRTWVRYGSQAANRGGRPTDIRVARWVGMPAKKVNQRATMRHKPRDTVTDRVRIFHVMERYSMLGSELLAQRAQQNYSAVEFVPTYRLRDDNGHNGLELHDLCRPTRSTLRVEILYALAKLEMKNEVNDYQNHHRHAQQPA